MELGYHIREYLRGAHAAQFDVAGDGSEHRGGEGQVEETIACGTLFDLEHLLVEVLKGILLCVRALHV